MKKIIEYIYELDAFSAVAHTAREYNLAFPNVIDSNQSYFKIKGMFHPFVQNPIKNDIHMDHNKNLWFISGANMAGKSTLLKSIGISVYLSHIGFPVPALDISLFDGLYTTINIADNINKGYSHYYNEVRRVKEISLRLK